MGFNTWNKFGCNVDEKLIRETADAMVETGMRDAGYRYLVIDDCWQVDRGADGRIVADPQRFAGGMKALADYVHSKGLHVRALLGHRAEDLRRPPGLSRLLRASTRPPTPSGASTTSRSTGATATTSTRRPNTRSSATPCAATGRPDRPRASASGAATSPGSGPRASASSGGRPPTSGTAGTASSGSIGAQLAAHADGGRPRRLERSRHARGRQRRHDLRRVQARTSRSGRSWPRRSWPATTCGR
ncbi:MAG: alpha-galactosidase [Marinilabiliales bacterium]|nr:alpha-galactosidase [Marinilabiliales bacterium]